MKVNDTANGQTRSSLTDIQVRSITRNIPDLSEYTLVTGA